MIRILCFVALVFLLRQFARADELADDDLDPPVSALRAGNNIAWSEVAVTILDPDGKPIEGATVRPWALRAGNAHGWWNDRDYGTPQRTQTDANGVTNVVYPKIVAWGGKQMETVVQVSIMVKHPEFCSNNAHVDVAGGVGRHPPNVTLLRGVRLRVAGIEPGSDRPLSHCHLMLENSDTSEPEFVRYNDGWLRSIPISEDRRWFRVVRLPPGEPPQFSKPQSWSPDDPDTRKVQIEVRRGTRILGKVSDNVARPIVRGHVVVWCGSPIHGEVAVKGQRSRPIWWIETVPIAEDGSFEFPSLPTGFLAQFYGFANDSISAQPSDDDFETCCKWFSEANRHRNDSFRYGQVWRLAGGESQITLKMEDAGQVRIKCVTPDGRPLRRINVVSWPNQYMVGGGSTVFCNRQSSVERLQGSQQSGWWKGNPYTFETNAAGEATIRNLPQGKQSINAGNETWMGNDEQQVDSIAGQTTEIELTLQRRD